MLIEIIESAGKKLDAEAEKLKFLYGEAETVVKPKLIISLPTSKHQTAINTFDELGISQEKYTLIPPLSTMDPHHPELVDVKVTIIEPSCSLSAAADPLQFLLLEGRLNEADKRLRYFCFPNLFKN